MSRDYPDDWDTRRKNVYKRDGYTCCNCKRQGGPYGDLELNAHHVVPKSRGGSHAYSNLITTCAACHSAIHGRRVVAPTTGRRRSHGKLWVHLVLLVTTLGIGNVVYWIHSRFRG